MCLQCVLWGKCVITTFKSLKWHLFFSFIRNSRIYEYANPFHFISKVSLLHTRSLLLSVTVKSILSLRALEASSSYVAIACAEYWTRIASQTNMMSQIVPLFKIRFFNEHRENEQLPGFKHCSRTILHRAAQASHSKEEEENTVLSKGTLESIDVGLLVHFRALIQLLRLKLTLISIHSMTSLPK